MKRTTSIAFAALVLAAAFTIPAGFAGAVLGVSAAQASEIAATVEKQVITSLDVSHRLAFLKLQRKKGASSAMALQEMIDDTLKLIETRKRGIGVGEKEINDAFANFAKQNKLSAAQLTQILNQSGVTAPHFKNYIRVQMAWGRAVGARMQASSKMSEADVVRKMLEKGGQKPTATEYMLQQVIFVVPAAKRGQIIGQRKKEATAFRAKFAGCESTKQAAIGLKDVTVRDLGRILAPALPPEWADMIKKTNEGQATGIRETEKRRRISGCLPLQTSVRRQGGGHGYARRGTGRRRRSAGRQIS